MSFSIPAMPLPVWVWRYLNGPPNPPDMVTVGNLAYGKRVTLVNGNFSAGLFDPVLAYLLVPAGTDIRDRLSLNTPDLLAVPGGTARLYIAEYVDDLGKGFPNEHRFVLMAKQLGWPFPYP